jgi:hypothetical protein
MDYVFKAQEFLNVSKPEAAYMLGLLWADGFLGSEKDCRISLEIVKADMQGILPIIIATGKWNLGERQRKNWQPQMRASINSRPLYEFLIKMDYKSKSESPTKILNHIPESLRCYFFLGWSDGDGCFYINLKNYNYQFAVSSSYDQDWSALTTLLESLDIKYTIQKRQNRNKTSGKLNSYSVVRVTSKREIRKLGAYLYRDLIGFNRKFEKLKLILQTG